MNTLENNLAKGNVVKQLVRFAIPFVLSHFIQNLYVITDMVIVGQFSGTNSMSGVSIGSNITFIVTTLIVGLSSGATVLIGQYFGANDRKSLKETIGTYFVLMLCFSLFLSAVMLIVCKPLLTLIKTPPESFSEAQSYLTVTAFGFVFIGGYNSLSAAIRGVGDSKRPLMFVAVACVLNVGLDLIAVAVLKWGAFGAALATIISQGLSMALCVAYLKRHDFVFDFRPKSFRIVPGHLTKLIKIALPTTFESFSVELSFLLSTAIINSFGVMASAAAGSAVMLVNFGIMPAAAMSGAISAMVSHNIGAKEYRRAAHTLYTGAAIAFGMCSVSFLLVRLFPYDLMSIFSTEPELISTGWQYLDPFSFDFFAVPFMFCMSGFFVGTGHTAFALFNDLLSSVFIRVPTAFLLGVVLGLGLGGVGLAAPLASASGAVVGLIFFLSGRWKRPVVIREKQSAVPAE